LHCSSARFIGAFYITIILNNRNFPYIIDLSLLLLEVLHFNNRYCDIYGGAETGPDRSLQSTVNMCQNV